MPDLITMSCPSCGGKLQITNDIERFACAFCGTEHIVRRQGDAVNLESYARCPLCKRNDKVEKITSILRKEYKNSSLAISLARPTWPENLAKPVLKPKPDLPPKPELLQKPSLTPKPDFSKKPSLLIEKPKRLLLTIGIILFSSGYLVLSASIGTFIDEFNPEDTGVFLVSFIIFITQIFIGLLLFFLGFTATRKISPKNSDILELKKDQNNKEKTKSRTRKLLITTSVITTFLIIFSFLIFIEESIGGLVFSISLSIIPVLIYLFFLLRNFLLKKISVINQRRLQTHENAIHEWRRNNREIEQKWLQENEKNTQMWRIANLLVEHAWEKQNNEHLIAWSHKNARITEEWEKRNSSALKEWKTATTRWEKLYFCHRDDIVFIPGEGSYSKIENLEQYVKK